MRGSLFWLVSITLICGLNGCQKRSVSFVVQDVNHTVKNVIEIALGHLGKPYAYGETGLARFDCSGFVYGVHKQLGILLPRTSLHQSQIEGKKISKDALQKGDLVFFDTSLKGKVNHSGIYLGEGRFIHASSGSAYSVTISGLDGWYKDKFKWGKRLNANQ